ncbi:class E sortase [bacterium]|nr:MAG: class E sortase [bacterium]
MNLLKGINYQRRKARIRKVFRMQMQVISLLSSVFLMTYVIYNYQTLSGNILANPLILENQIELPGTINIANFKDSSPFLENVNASEITFDDSIPNDEQTKLIQEVSNLQSNSLMISNPKIKGGLVEGSMNEGEAAMTKGFWVYPNGFTPEVIGTTVIYGHRYYHMPPKTETFYNLDKVHVGESIEISWKGQIYKYQVIDTRIVEKTDWSAVKNEGFQSIKLVTCTPIGSDKQRIVITARII